VSTAAAYEQFLASKTRMAPTVGRGVEPDEVHPRLHPFQSDLVRWSVEKGRAGLWTTTGTGKALDSDTLVVTPTGMVSIRDLQVGDFVTGADGHPTRVEGVFPQGERLAYRVAFSDDTSIVSDDEHLWNVRTRGQAWSGRGWRTLTLREIRTRTSRDRLFIPMVEQVQFVEQELPLHPYLLGCLIGDGHIKKRSAEISSGDEELIERLRDVVPLGVTIEKKRYSRYDYAFGRTGRLTGRGGSHVAHPVVVALEELELQGHGAEAKFIPDQYKFAAPDTRLLLLQGLMDTDGYAGVSNGSSTLEFCTVSKRLAEDFVWLVQSFGGKARIRTKQTTGRLAYRITPALPKDINPFLLKRKADAFRPRTKYMPARTIASIDPVGVRDMTCIKVAAEDGLFVVDGFIVTHNTSMQLEFARLSGATSLIVAPLAVCQQTVREAALLDIDAHYVRSGEQITGPGVWVTNYEMVDRFDPRELDVAVLDEGSVLRDSTGATRNLLIDHFAGVPRRLSCTATPAPNDAEELTNQCAFLGVMSRVDMLSSYFIHDDSGWKVKPHARQPMYRWLASWAVALRRPSDIGYSDVGYELPGLEVIPELVPVRVESDGQLFATDLGGVSGTARVRRETMPARCARAAELVEASPNEPWLLWTGLNAEADLLANLIPSAVNVHGAMSPEEKADLLLGFADGQIPHLISKPSICGRGLNFQRCAHQAMVGMGFSFEDYFQCIRRSYRYGQTRVVRVHVILSELEQQIAHSVALKEREHDRMMDDLVREMWAVRRTEVAV
jgi:hypothetical protein